ncbi:MAG TPA: CoA ester lyase [Chloroflexota bacterium]|nr:CoA ester lyase [Chloroflexota bacterium]
MKDSLRDPIDWTSRPLRTLLFAPGDQPRKLAKVATFGADAVILDLEDAVAASRKAEARALVREALPGYAEVPVVVRVNAVSTGLGFDDLAAVVGPALQAVMLPKTEDPDELRAVDRRLAALEHERSIPRDTIRLIPLIETARGVARLERIADAAPARVLTLAFGPGDLTTDLGVDLTREGTELLYARSRLVIAARARGLAPPIDGPYLLDLQDREGLIEDTRRGRGLGYGGRALIYPAHVGPVNAVFSEISADELARCREIVAGFEAAEAGGTAALQIGGRLVDYPIYRRALQKLRLYQAEHPSDSEDFHE